MASFTRWFRSKAPAAPKANVGDLDRKLLRLEEEAEAAAPGFEGTPLNRAGDLCFKAGDRVRALTYYGRAIDSFLEDQQRDAARGVANKIIRIHPDAVRTLCTLTWLDLASRHMATALVDLREYVRAAKRSHQEKLAGGQILNMARVATQEEFLDAAADALDRLDCARDSERVREWARSGGSEDAIADPDKLAAFCLSAAVGSNAARKKDGEGVA